MNSAASNALRYGTGSCFSAWIGRVNPTPNLGFLDDRDASEFANAVWETFNIRVTLYGPDSPSNLGDVANRIQAAHSETDTTDIWKRLRRLTARIAEKPENDILPSTTFFERCAD